LPDVRKSPVSLAAHPVSSFSNPSSRRQLAEMKQTLALARVARDDVRAAYATSMQKLEAARTELATIMRRGDLSARPLACWSARWPCSMRNWRSLSAP
jgi:hypothetical protein